MSIEKEKQTVREMIELYCRLKHKSRDNRCDVCAELLTYAEARLDRCPFGDAKSVCRHCEIHCYNPEMRGKVAAVMRFAGPRMLIQHPVSVLRHLRPNKK